LFSFLTSGSFALSGDFSAIHIRLGKKYKLLRQLGCPLKQPTSAFDRCLGTGSQHLANSCG